MMRVTRSNLAAACLAAASLASFAPAHAGLFDDDEARKAILDLRSKIDTLRQETDTKLADKADKSSTIDLLNQNEELKQEVAKLRGQIEVLTNDLANAQQRQKDFYVDLDNRLRNLEPKKVSVDGHDVDMAPDEQKAYDSAMALFKDGDYKGAGAALNDFLRRYPGSAFAASAQYALGNSYYVQSDYKGALSAQQAVIKNYPDSPKAPEALLSIASCYVELKDKPGAKRALDMLLKQYPDSPSAQTAKERLRSLK
ncbi:MAG: tol-pal system protein YbgF [Burkholderiaceae bacterium]|nr:tol-pal system protein YbgF [Burkholderiaceae bacterium]